MNKFKVGDLLKDEWNDTLWLVLEVWEHRKSRQGVVIRRHSRGSTYMHRRDSKNFTLVSRPNKG